MRRLISSLLILVIAISLLISFGWKNNIFEVSSLMGYFGMTDVNNLESLADYPTENGQVIVPVNGVLIAPYENYQIKENYVLIDRVPKVLKQAFLAIEDSRFYSHPGYDFLGLARALTINLRSQEYKAGGSTITQQLVKNMFLSPEKTLKRKIVEFMLASRLEKEFDKDQILEMYLNQIYFGPGIYGIGKASQSFFEKQIKDISLAEAAMLAGILKNPKSYSPVNNIRAAKERQAVVLDRMEKLGYIDAKEKAKALKEELVIVK